MACLLRQGIPYRTTCFTHVSAHSLYVNCEQHSTLSSLLQIVYDMLQDTQLDISYVDVDVVLSSK